MTNATKMVITFNLFFSGIWKKFTDMCKDFGLLGKQVHITNEIKSLKVEIDAEKKQRDALVTDLCDSVAIRFHSLKDVNETIKISDSETIIINAQNALVTSVKSYLERLFSGSLCKDFESIFDTSRKNTPTFKKAVLKAENGSLSTHDHDGEAIDANIKLQVAARDKEGKIEAFLNNVLAFLRDSDNSEKTAKFGEAKKAMASVIEFFDMSDAQLKAFLRYAEQGFAMYKLREVERELTTSIKDCLASPDSFKRALLVLSGERVEWYRVELERITGLAHTLNPAFDDESTALASQFQSETKDERFGGKGLRLPLENALSLYRAAKRQAEKAQEQVEQTNKQDERIARLQTIITGIKGNLKKIKLPKAKASVIESYIAKPHATSYFAG